MKERKCCTPVTVLFWPTLKGNTARISPCSHEEADTRLLLYAIDSGKEGCRKVVLRTIDTDTLMLALSLPVDLDLEELWIAFGAGKPTLPSMRLMQLLDKRSANLFLFFFFFFFCSHAFTGCDQSSAFAGRGKSTAWNIWMENQEATDVFRSLSKTPTVDELSFKCHAHYPAVRGTNVGRH